jgi:NTP pyrophosphatase (non-canonical NTP hydrolase)
MRVLCYAEPVAVPARSLQTCLVWIRFSSSRLERLPDLVSRFLFELTAKERRPLSDKSRKNVRLLSGFAVQRMDIQQLTDKMHDLVRSKGWYDQDSKRPQTPRNLAISLALEAAEILEHFQFREDLRDKQELAGELADVALYLLQLASITEIDLEQAILEKIEINKKREWDQE